MYQQVIYPVSLAFSFTNCNYFGYKIKMSKLLDN